jgi:hypothetical protein
LQPAFRGKPVFILESSIFHHFSAVFISCDFYQKFFGKNFNNNMPQARLRWAQILPWPW